LNEFHESIFSLANGYMGVRATPEEGFSAETGSAPHTFVAPVYDLIKSGCDWRVGYVTHCSILAVAPNWFGMDITLGGVRFDPRQGKVSKYRRTLDLMTGTLTRAMIWQDSQGRQTELSFTRLVSQAEIHIGAIRLELRPINWGGKVSVELSLDGQQAKNQVQVSQDAIESDGASLLTKTLATEFETAMTFRSAITCDGKAVAVTGKTISRDKYIARKQTFTVCQGQTYRIDKLVAVCSSRDKNQKKPAGVRATMIASGILERGFDEIHQAHIAAKGLSGHGYGGLYWWDTEAYMVPFFLYTAPEKARTLLLYRFFTLAGARHKASLHSYDGAMFPWVTIDGEERSYDWNYGALEQHVGSAVTHAIRQYVSATGDNDFLFDYGAEVVLETSRLGYEPA
jgi:trehalose/maltose hydrolase-like predicted phosphorylase